MSRGLLADMIDAWNDPFTRAAAAGRAAASGLLAASDAWKAAAPIFLRLEALTHPAEAAALAAVIPEAP